VQEQAWIPDQGWEDTEFLLDALMSHGDMYHIKTDIAR
jgi:hypothetical protein